MPRPHHIFPATRRRALVGVAVAVLALLASSCALARPEGDAPLRFRDQVFSGYTKTTGIVYGQAVNHNGENQVLDLDLWQPAGDTMTARPLIIWVHGGSFKSGTKASPEIVDQAQVFAQKGYVTASITYRLDDTGCTGGSSTCVESIYDAIEDAQAAVRFFRRYAAAYGIDPNRIAINGSSAGAITSLNVGYQTPVPGNSGNPGYPSTVRAAVSLSGAQIFNGSIGPGDAPAMDFHGTNDGLVPYSWAQSTVDTARDAGLLAYLVTFPGDGHVPYQHRDEIIDLTTNFLYNVMDLQAIN